MDEMRQPLDWSAPGVDVEKPSAARVYDYLLGGNHNFAVDREFAHKVIELMPDGPLQAQANRAFLHRAVRYLVEVGVRQFLDIGSGIPTLGNVHEVAQRAAPDARVVYVDIDPVAVAHSRAILATNDRAIVIQEDLRQPDAIVANPQVRALLDFTQPIGVLMVAILHAIPDADDPYGIVARLRDVLAPGSYLAIAHGTDESRPEEVGAVRGLSNQLSTPLTTRTHRDVERFFTGFDLVEPGLVWAPAWHPDAPVEGNPELSGNYVGVGRKA
jgi:SAM-dependent methyltransferase